MRQHDRGIGWLKAGWTAALHASVMALPLVIMLAWRSGDELVYAGNAGSGLSDKGIAELLPALRVAVRTTPAFTASDPLVRNAVFVHPSLIADVRFTETTERGVMRQPVLVGWRAGDIATEVDAPPAERSA